MFEALWDVISGFLFVITGGTVRRETFEKYRSLVLIASAVAVMGAISLFYGLYLALKAPATVAPREKRDSDNRSPVSNLGVTEATEQKNVTNVFVIPPVRDSARAGSAQSNPTTAPQDTRAPSKPEEPATGSQGHPVAPPADQSSGQDDSGARNPSAPRYPGHQTTQTANPTMPSSR